MAGILYLVGTPIGNLGDITLRALETLKSVDCIACEDTRHSLRLLNHFEIKKKLIACHQHNERESAEKIAELLEQGNKVALISDAGMPCISDPGSFIVNHLNSLGYKIEVVPGATAVASAIALCGLTQPIWTFIGFLPSKNKEKDLILDGIGKQNTALVFYCSPYDINNDLSYLYRKLGERKVHIVKEITKLYESHTLYNLSQANIENPRGEYVIVVEPKEKCDNIEQNTNTIIQQVQILIESGMDKKTAVKKVAKDNNLPKDDVYKQAINL